MLRSIIDHDFPQSGRKTCLRLERRHARRGGHGKVQIVGGRSSYGKDPKKQYAKVQTVSGRSSNGKDIRKQYREARREKQEYNHGLTHIRASACLNWTQRQRQLHGAAQRNRAADARRSEREQARQTRKAARCQKNLQHNAIVHSPACKKCGGQVQLTASQKQWYESRQLNLPVRCPACRRGGSTKLQRSCSQSQVLQEFTISGDAVSKLIGKGGCNIQGIENAHCVKINIKLGRSILGSSVATVHIRGGSLDQVAAAIKQCTQLIV